MKKQIKYWIDLSDYDLETAEAMLSGRRYFYVGFMCHQTIEKAFKAYFSNQRTSKMDKREAIEKVKAYKSLLKKHLPLEKIFMFGSYAKDTYRDDSDIDVAIVVKEMEGDFFSIHSLLWKLRRQVDDRIEPVLIERDFDDAGFLEEILKNGIEVS